MKLKKEIRNEMMNKKHVKTHYSTQNKKSIIRKK